MKQTYGKKEATGAAGAPGAFSQTTMIGEQPTKGMEYFYNKLDRLEEKLGRMNLSDQGPQKPPFKPNVTPRQRHGGGPHPGGSFRYNPNNRDQRDFYNRDRWDNRDRARFRGQGFKRPQRPYRGGFKGKFDKSPNIPRPRVAKKTHNKDEGRCHYCKEHGHWQWDCIKKAQDNLRQAEKQHMKLIQGHQDNDDIPTDYDQNQSLTETDPFLDESQDSQFALNNQYAQLNN